MSKYRHTHGKIKELEEEIKFLNKSLDYSVHLNNILQNRFDEAEKQRINYRKVIRYHSLLLIVMSLLSQTNGETDIDKLFKRNIMDFYSALSKDLMEIPNNDNDVTDNEFDNETEGFDESESDDLWDAKEEYE
jgi:hypothetical protein